MSTLDLAADLDRPTVAVLLKGGLGNRLTGLIAARIVSQRFDAALEIIWQSDERCPEPFSTFFERPDWANTSWFDRRTGAESWPLENEIRADRIRETMSRRDRLCVHARDIFGQDLSDRSEFDAAMRAEAARLRPQPEIAARLRHAAPRAGVHARMTDHLPARMLTPRWCYAQAVGILARHTELPPPFVCSDTDSFTNAMAKKYRDRVLTFPPSSRSDARAEAQRAAADLLQLARCEYIFASKASSFARVAVSLGTGKLVPLDGLARVLRSKQELFAWALYHRVRYDFPSGRWVRIEGGKFKLSDALALLAARFISSPLYQDIGNPFHRARFRREINALVAHIAQRDRHPDATAS